MSNFKAGTFYLALLSLTAICAGTPAFAETQAVKSSSSTELPVIDAPAVKSSSSTELPVIDAPAVKNSSPTEFATNKNLTVSATATEPTTQSDDVLPTDRNVQVLRSLNSKYQCGVGELDKTVSRSDFANSIVTCLEALEAKIAQSPGAIPASDLAQLKELTNNFMGEVTTLNNRVESVEKKVAVLQSGSTFSTTTKLVGEVIIGLNAFSSQTGKPATDTNGGSVVVTNRVRLNFDTSFTGKDRLRTRLESRNNIPFNGGNVGTPPVNILNGGTGTNTTRLGWDGDEGNSTNLSLLQYTLPVFNGSKLVIDATGSEFNENMYTFNPLLAPAAVGSISRFGRFNPVYRQSGLGTAATLDYKFSKDFTGSIGYAVPLGAVPAPGAPGVGIANNPASGAGIFGGNYAAIAQVRYQPSSNIDLGLSFARSYHASGAGVTAATGSAIANAPFGAVPTVANHYSFSASSKISPGFVLSGWVGLTNANVESGGISSGSADIFNAAITAAFPDLGGKGNALGFVVGIPPKVTNTTASANLPGVNGRSNPDTTLHLETFYKFKVSDNLYITPGVLLITSPESSNNSALNRGSEFVGTVRTTFFF
jgi:Carbohydrate-selective porin, OprB family